MRFLLALIFVAATAAFAMAQCPFTPTVTGNMLICPEGRTTLGTQSYDAYQWYTRPFGGGTAQPVNGAVGPIFTVDYNNTPLYVSVAATLNNCTERSAEVLVDGLVFLPLVVQSDGEFTVGPMGEAVICAGDTMFLIALQPYTTNIQWYDGNTPIPGAHNDTLIVTRPGSYWLTASPGQCPDLTVGLGVVIEVVWSDIPGCVSAVREPRRLDASVLPNPASDFVEIIASEPGPVEMVLHDLAGHVLRRQMFVSHTTLRIAELPRGVYILRLRSEDGALAQIKLSKLDSL